MNGLKFTVYATDKTKAAFQGLNSKLDGLGRKLKNLGKDFGGIKTAAIAAFAFGASHLSEYEDELERVSAQLNISTGELTKMNFYAELNATNLNQLSKVVAKLGSNISKAQQGSATYVNALADLKLSSEDLINLPLDQQFSIVASRIGELDSQATKLRITEELLSEQGIELMHVFDQGKNSMSEMRRESELLGISMSDNQVKAIGDLGDTWYIFKETVVAVFRDLYIQIAPILKSILGMFTYLIKVIRNFIEVLGKVGKVIRTSFTDLFTGSNNALKAFDELKSKGTDFYDALTNNNKKYNKELAKTGSLFKTLKTDLGGTSKSSAKSEKAKSPIESLEGNENKLSDIFSDAANQFRSNWLDAIFDTEEGFNNLGQRGKDTLLNLGKSLASELMGNFVGGADGKGGIMSMIMGLFSGGGSSPSLSSSGGGGASGVSNMFSSFQGFFAKGGDFMAGRPMVVGESGPELMIPSRSGAVIPNNAIGGGMVVNMNIQTPDASSFRKSESQLTAEMANIMQKAKRNM